MAMLVSLMHYLTLSSGGQQGQCFQPSVCRGMVSAKNRLAAAGAGLLQDWLMRLQRAARSRYKTTLQLDTDGCGRKSCTCPQHEYAQSAQLLSCALSDVLKFRAGCTSFARTTSASCSRLTREVQGLTRPQAGA